MIIASNAGPSLTTNSIMRCIRQSKLLSVGKTTFTIVSSKGGAFLGGFVEEFNEKDFLFWDDESDDLEVEDEEEDDDDDEREDDDDEEEVDVEFDDVRRFFFSIRFFNVFIVLLNFDFSCGWALKGKPEGGGGMVWYDKKKYTKHQFFYYFIDFFNFLLTTSTNSGGM